MSVPFSSPRKITIFLIQGTPQGLRWARVSDWVGQAMVCPRSELHALAIRSEAKKPGVYLLVGRLPDDPTRLSIYVGETDEVTRRLAQHHAKKDDWDYVVFFTSQNDELNKAHVRWLEYHLFQEIEAAKRATLTNQGGVALVPISEHETAEMKSFYGHIKLLASALGIDIFSVETEFDYSPASAISQPEFIMRVKTAEARCIVVDGKFVICKGSTACRENQKSIPGNISSMRVQLFQEKVLIDRDSNLWVFTQDFPFNSPSAAADVIAGASLNGRTYWRTVDGNQTYAEWERDQV